MNVQLSGSFNRIDLVSIVREAIHQVDKPDKNILFLCSKLDNIVERLGQIEQNQRQQIFEQKRSK